MKLKFRYYAVAWAALVVLFHVIVFMTPNELKGMNKFGSSFWVGYIFIMLTFIGQLFVAWLAVKDDGITKLFYSIPLIRISYTALIVMVVVGTLSMSIPKVPYWAGIIGCLFVLIFAVIALMGAQAASSVVTDIDEEIKNKTFFIKSLTVDAESLMGKETSAAIKDEIKKVYEAVRYSDPMSNDALNGIESQITLRMSELVESVEKGDINLVSKNAKEIIVLVNDRNRKGKLLK